jgi:hypothetical protein
VSHDVDQSADLTLKVLQLITAGIEIDTRTGCCGFAGTTRASMIQDETARKGEAANVDC